MLVAVVGALLAATAVVVWTPREATPTPIKTVAADDTPADTGAATSASPATSTAEADAPPPADATVQDIVTRWATRESPTDDSWSSDLTGMIAPDTDRRIRVMSCLPVDAAPLRVDGITPEGEATATDTTYSRDLTLTVTDATGAQTPVTVRAKAAWSEPTSTWTLTGLECLSSGGNE